MTSTTSDRRPPSIVLRIYPVLLALTWLSLCDTSLAYYEIASNPDMVLPDYALPLFAPSSLPIAPIAPATAPHSISTFRTTSARNTLQHLLPFDSARPHSTFTLC